MNNLDDLIVICLFYFLIKALVKEFITKPNEQNKN